MTSKWDGPYRIVEQVKDSDNYRLEHACTGKQLDPTNVDKLIRVEPWALDNQNEIPASSIPDQENLLQAVDFTPAPRINAQPDFSEGDFVVFEQAGSDHLIDDDVRDMITVFFTG